MIETRRTTAGNLLVVTLDRPERRNALTPAGLDDLETAVANADTPVVYLEGAGPAFCAGADLDVVAGLDPDEAEAFARRGQRVASTIESAESVVVAGIDGAARGGGVELALACDVRLGTEQASFAESGVEHGLFGAWGGTIRLPRVVGQGEAMDIALSGRVIDADEACRMGLVSRVVADPASVAASIAAHDDHALRTIKTRLRDDASDDKQERREAAAFAELVERASFDRS